VPDQSSTQRPSRGPWPAIAIVVIVTLVAIYYVPSEDNVESVPVPVTSSTSLIPAPAPLAPNSSDRIDARTLITELRTASKPDYNKAYDAGEMLRKKGQLDQAYILYFYAAREGHANAAYRLGQFADNIISKTTYRPNATQAIKWYHNAKKAGVNEAADTLDALKRYYEDKARSGDTNARRLLLLWR
jgi:hypothetical protein